MPLNAGPLGSEMSRFEFNSVLVSIMLAFAAAELVTAWGRVLREPRRFGFSWQFALLSIWLLLVLVSHWFGLWSYREVPFDAMFHSLFVLLPALTLALLAHVLTPQLDLKGPGALQQHYLSVSRTVLLLAGLVQLLSTLTDVALPGVLDDAPPGYFIATALSFFAIAFTSRLFFHTVVLGGNAAISAVVMAVVRT